MILPWWEAFPGRLEFELRALDEANICYSKDDKAFSQGVLRLDLQVTCNGETLKLRATYPDAYPYFRVEVCASELALQHHQHPFSKNLCFLGRSTDNWKTNDTLASLISDRLATVLLAGRSADKAAVRDLEQQQAEPYADYFSYASNSSVIIAGDFSVPSEICSGTLILGLENPKLQILRGALLEIQDENGNTLGAADSCIATLYTETQIAARWVRLSQPPAHNDWAKIFQSFALYDPHSGKARNHSVTSGKLMVRAGLFPQEINDWRIAEEGWLFACKFTPTSARKKKDAKRRKRS